MPDQSAIISAEQGALWEELSHTDLSTVSPVTFQLLTDTQLDPWQLALIETWADARLTVHRVAETFAKIIRGSEAGQILDGIVPEQREVPPQLGDYQYDVQATMLPGNVGVGLIGLLKALSAAGVAYGLVKFAHGSEDLPSDIQRTALASAIPLLLIAFIAWTVMRS